MTAWEVLRQVALTRTCLAEIVRQNDYPTEWTAPDPEVRAFLHDWAMAVSLRRHDRALSGFDVSDGPPCHVTANVLGSTRIRSVPLRSQRSLLLSLPDC